MSSASFFLHEDVFFEQKGLTHTALIAFDASTLTERLEQVTESFPSLYS
jgi:hypothetical protein